jgi:hypothetical protein
MRRTNTLSFFLDKATMGSKQAWMKKKAAAVFLDEK